MANHNSNNISNTHSKGDRVEPVGHNTPHNAWDPLTPHVEHQDMPAEPSTGPTVSHEMAADHPQAIERAVEQGMEAYNQGDLLAHEEIAAMYGGGVTADPPQGSSSQSGRPRAGWAEQMEQMARRGDDHLPDWQDPGNSSATLVHRFATPPTAPNGEAADQCYYVPITVELGDHGRYYASTALVTGMEWIAGTLEEAVTRIKAEIMDCIRRFHEGAVPVTHSVVLTAWLRVPSETVKGSQGGSGGP